MRITLRFQTALASTFLVCSLAATAVGPVPAGAGVTPTSCSLAYNLPGDLTADIPSNATDTDFMVFSWQHFLALNAPSVGGQINANGDNTTQWSAWSSTADLLNQTNPGSSGSRYYPPACQTVPDFQNYRAIQQVGKVDDSFLEAQVGGLSENPVLDGAGNFLRYEILLSPAMYDDVISQGLNEPAVLANLSGNVNFICGDVAYTGGDPANAQMGAIIIKNAWRDATGFSAQELAEYHSEQLLVYSPGYRNSSGQDTCELKTMALVAMHLAHKTVKQPNWVWATYEHLRNAPDCTTAPAAPMPQAVGTNKNCPQVDPNENIYTFYPAMCSAQGDQSCAACNTPPAKNGIGECTNPFVDPEAENGWCLDLPPNPAAGTSRLCRQVPVAHGYCSNDFTIVCASVEDCGDPSATCNDFYPAVKEQNTACWDAIIAAGGGQTDSAWLNYQLIGAHWVALNYTTCQNNATVVSAGPDGPVDFKDVRELVTLAVDDQQVASVTRPVLGNTALESYDRPNCLGCHAKSYLSGICSNNAGKSCASDSDCGSGTCMQNNTDFMYFLKLEVAQPPALRLPGRRLRYGTGLAADTERRVKVSARADNALVGEEGSVNDPRCNGAADGVVKASVRFHRDGVLLPEGQVDLPCERWRLRTDDAGNPSLRYRDTDRQDGPCRRVVITTGTKVVLRCRGGGLPDLAGSGTAPPLQVSVVTGLRRHCTEFSVFRDAPPTSSADLIGKSDGVRPSMCADLD